MNGIDTRMPQWMIEKNFSSPRDSVSHDLQTGYQLGQRNREMELREQYQQSQLRSLEAYRETQINSLLMRQQQMQYEQEDAAAVTAWMRDPSQPPPAGLKTPKAIASVAAVQKTYAATQRQGIFGAVQKSYNDQLKNLDAMGLLKVQQALSQTEGVITPEIATIIDAEQARLKLSSQDIQVLDEMGEPYVKGGENKPAFLRSTKTGALHKLPQDWSGEAIPLTDVDNNVIGYGVRNASGGITQLRPEKTATTTLPPEKRAAMNLEFKTVQSWWDGLDSRQKAKPENQTELKRRIANVEDKYSTAPATPAATPVAPNDFQQKYDALPSGSTYTAPDGTIRTKR